MAEDDNHEPKVKIFPRAKAATIGPRQSDKRHAMSNLPSWNEVSAMYSEEQGHDVPASPHEGNRRWSMFPTTKTPLDQPLASSSIKDRILPEAPTAPAPQPPRRMSMSLEPNMTLSAPAEPLSAATSVDQEPLNTLKIDRASSSMPPSGEATFSGTASSSSSSSVATSSAPAKAPTTYEEYLALSKTMDFEHIKAAQFAYKSGVDFAGRPVVVVCGSMPPAVTPEQLFLYIIDLLDPITEVDYSLVYVVMSDGKKPSFAFLRKFYSTMSRKYKKNLKQLFVVQPSFWVRAGFQFFRPFISSKFWKKVVYVHDMRQLYQYMSPSQVRFPLYVTSQPGFLKSSNSNTILFGQSLEIAMTLPMNENLPFPALVQLAIDAITNQGLHTEGIFRISGNSARMKEIQASYDKGIKIALDAEDIHVVAGILKRYLRELPEPLVPFSTFTSLSAVANEVTPDDIKIATIQASLCELPAISFHILDQLTILLSKVAANHATNKMTASNLAIVVGPNIMYSEASMTNPTAAMSSTAAIVSIYSYMIAQIDTLFKPARLKNA